MASQSGQIRGTRPTYMSEQTRTDENNFDFAPLFDNLHQIKESFRKVNEGVSARKRIEKKNKDRDYRNIMHQHQDALELEKLFNGVTQNQKPTKPTNMHNNKQLIAVNKTEKIKPQDTTRELNAVPQSVEKEFSGIDYKGLNAAWNEQNKRSTQDALSLLQYTIREAIIDKVFNEAEFKALPFNKFDEFIKSDRLRARLGDRLRKINPLFTDADPASLDQTLKSCDKGTFADLKKHNLSFCQFKRKVWEQRTGIKYLSFDDIKPSLYEGFEERQKKWAPVSKLIAKHVPQHKKDEIDQFEKEQYQRRLNSDRPVGNNAAGQQTTYENRTSPGNNNMGSTTCEPGSRKKMERPGLIGDRPFDIKCFKANYMPSLRQTRQRQSHFFTNQPREAFRTIGHSQENSLSDDNEQEQDRPPQVMSNIQAQLYQEKMKRKQQAQDHLQKAQQLDLTPRDRYLNKKKENKAQFKNTLDRLLYQKHQTDLAKRAEYSDGRAEPKRDLNDLFFMVRRLKKPPTLQVKANLNKTSPRQSITSSSPRRSIQTRGSIECQNSPGSGAYAFQSPSGENSVGAAFKNFNMGDILFLERLREDGKPALAVDETDAEMLELHKFGPIINQL